MCIGNNASATGGSRRQVLGVSNELDINSGPIIATESKIARLIFILPPNMAQTTKTPDGDGKLTLHHLNVSTYFLTISQSCAYG
jgi:hypothetical protein